MKRCWVHKKLNKIIWLQYFRWARPIKRAPSWPNIIRQMFMVRKLLFIRKTKCKLETVWSQKILKMVFNIPIEFDGLNPIQTWWKPPTHMQGFKYLPMYTSTKTTENYPVKTPNSVREWGDNMLYFAQPVAGLKRGPGMGGGPVRGRVLEFEKGIHGNENVGTICTWNRKKWWSNRTKWCLGMVSESPFCGAQNVEMWCQNSGFRGDGS